MDEEDRLKEEIAECNAYKPDFAVAIHTNAGGGTGFEVYYQLEPWEHTKDSVAMAQSFDNNVCKYMGVNTRGLKSNPNLGWLKQVNVPCILVENFFIDGPRVTWYSAPEQLEKLSKAYVRSILEFYGIAYNAESVETLRYQIVNADLSTAKNCTCPAILLDGSYYVKLRPFSKNLGMAVHYEEQTKRTLLYPPEYYTEEEFQSGALCIDDFMLSLKEQMTELPAEEKAAWQFDEQS